MCFTFSLRAVARLVCQSNLAHSTHHKKDVLASTRLSCMCMREWSISKSWLRLLTCAPLSSTQTIRTQPLPRTCDSIAGGHDYRQLINRAGREYSSSLCSQSKCFCTLRHPSRAEHTPEPADFSLFIRVIPKNSLKHCITRSIPLQRLIPLHIHTLIHSLLCSCLVLIHASRLILRIFNRRCGIPST